MEMHEFNKSKNIGIWCLLLGDAAYLKMLQIYILMMLSYIKYKIYKNSRVIQFNRTRNYRKISQKKNL